MKKVGILTDNSCGLTIEESKAYGIGLILMPVIIDNQEYLDIDNDLLFNLVSQGKKPKTSQPSIGVLKSKFSELLEEYESIIYIPLSSGLSSTVHTAKLISEEFNGKVNVIDTKKVSILMYSDVLFANRLAEEGYDAQYICHELEKRIDKDFAIIAPFNLTYLKLGGRISKVTAAIGNLIGIKPLIKFDNGFLDEYAKARSVMKSKAMMTNAVKNAPINPLDYNIVTLYTDDNEDAKMFYESMRDNFPEYNILYAKLPTNISAHTGPNTIGIAYCLKY